MKNTATILKSVPLAATGVEAKPLKVIILTEDVRKYAAKQGVSEQEALTRGMEAKSKGVVQSGAEVCAKA